MSAAELILTNGQLLTNSGSKMTNLVSDTTSPDFLFELEGENEDGLVSFSLMPEDSSRKPSSQEMQTSFPVELGFSRTDDGQIISEMTKRSKPKLGTSASPRPAELVIDERVLSPETQVASPQTIDTINKTTPIVRKTSGIVGGDPQLSGFRNTVNFPSSDLTKSPDVRALTNEIDPFEGRQKMRQSATGPEHLPRRDVNSTVEQSGDETSKRISVSSLDARELSHEPRRAFDGVTLAHKPRPSDRVAMPLRASNQPVTFASSHNSEVWSRSDAPLSVPGGQFSAPVTEKNAQPAIQTDATKFESDSASFRIDEIKPARSSLSIPSEVKVEMNAVVHMPENGGVRGQSQPHGQMPERVIQQVVFQIQANGPQSEVTAFEVRLDPEELGKLRINIVPRDAGLAISIVAERQETLDLLRRHSSDLLEGLLSTDFEEATLDFSQGEAFQDVPVYENSGVQTDDEVEEQLPVMVLPPINVGNERLDIRL